MLIAHKLAITLQGTPILHGITAMMEPGTITAICGPNGAGKSTLLAGLAGLLPLCDGQALLNGEDIGALPLSERARKIGYLPQDGAIAWDMTVRNLVGLGRLPHGDERTAAGQAAIEQAIAMLDLDHLAHRPLSRLSGGERSRTLLARVLAGEPDWVLADEPLAALDLAQQLALLARLQDIAHNGAGVVMVLHDLALAMNYADHVLVLQDGRLAADGGPEQALSAPLIAQVWGVKGGWLGPEGARAFVPDRLT